MIEERDLEGELFELDRHVDGLEGDVARDGEGDGGEVEQPADAGVDELVGDVLGVFRRHGQTYVDVAWARRLADNLEDLSRLRRCDTFRRFAEAVAGRAI